MGLENLLNEGPRPKTRTIKKLKVPPKLAVKVQEIARALKRDFNTTLLELADEGTKAYKLYEASRATKPDDPEADGVR